MQRIKGKSVCKGIAIGRIKIYSKEDVKVVRYHIEEAEAEIQRFEEARADVLRYLGTLYDKAISEIGRADAEIFKSHQVMLEDVYYIDAVTHIITSEMVNAEYAVACTSDNFVAMFEAMNDEYMRARTDDVRDISNRIINALQGKQEALFGSDEAAIIAADDLAPSETVQFDKGKVLAFVTRKGSTNSHTAILARTMDIPALIGIDFETSDIEGSMAIVDGYEGCLYIEPDEELILKYKNKQEKDLEKKKLLLELRGKPNRTIDGKEIMLYANIGGVGDVMSALKNDAAGIGLFRSEFLYLESEDYPSEEKQFNAYKTVARNMAGKRVIIRTLDIGADKRADYFHIGHEENPAMGYRAIRICLDRVEIFKTQLRAIYRASAFGNISVMFPMIISVEEVRRIKDIIAEVTKELDDMSIAYKRVELGIMIETPAAVMISDLLAKEVDFFSIGTNDLTQYTLAIDRQNSRLEHLYDSHHEAILRMIKMVVENGHREGCFVGICGELAADTSLTETFLRMGIDELSVSPTSVLAVKNEIRRIDLSK